MLTRSSERKPLFIAGTGVACGLIALSAHHGSAWHAAVGIAVGMVIGFVVTALRNEEF